MRVKRKGVILIGPATSSSCCKNKQLASFVHEMTYYCYYCVSNMAPDNCWGCSSNFLDEFSARNRYWICGMCYITKPVVK